MTAPKREREWLASSVDFGKGRFMRFIGPEGLVNHVGDRIIIYEHSGNGVYDPLNWILESASETQDHDFNKAWRNFGANYTEPLRHGTIINLSGKDNDWYIFIDDSD